MPQHLTLIVGTRASNLSQIQTGHALATIRSMLPGIDFDVTPMSSPGDEDKGADLKTSAADFFTRFLDNAVRDGTVDLAIHSAKDLPEPMPDGLDWFWLPWHEDARDVLVLATGSTIDDLPPCPVAGVSSERREQYIKTRFPDAQQKYIRGTIEERLDQLDRGDFDMVIIAGAALNRLGLQARINEWIPTDALAPPDGQGALAVTFRVGDARLMRLRALAVKAVTFVGAGPGHPDLISGAGIRALSRCDVCLYDALATAALLQHLRPDARAIFVGKRKGVYSIGKEKLYDMLTDLSRQGLRVVRLKGGDPGIFGRLAEEIDTLDALALPHRVIPGISSLTAATTGTGMMLTRRDVSAGATFLTPRHLAAGERPLNPHERARLPQVFFMGVFMICEIRQQLLDEGMAPDTAATMVFGAGTVDEMIVNATLDTIVEPVRAYSGTQPGLLIVGSVADAKWLYRSEHGALEGQRVLLTCSAELMPAAAADVHDYGGRPVEFPLLELVPEPRVVDALEGIGDFDWVTLTSPAAAGILVGIMRDHDLDIRSIPKIIVSGAGVTGVLREFGLQADAVPGEAFSAESVVVLAKSVMSPGERVLRLRSDLAETTLGGELEKLGMDVTDAVLYRNRPIEHDTLPAFGAVLFASSSAARRLIEKWGVEALADKTVVAIGRPTVDTLNDLGVAADVVPAEATCHDSITALAAWMVAHRLSSTGLAG